MLEFLKANKDGITTLSTLVAAILPAILALFALYQISLQRRNEELKSEKEQIRILITERIVEMGESAYEVLAQANILVSKFRKDKPNVPKPYYEALEETKNHIDEKKKILIEARRKDRYSLFGLEDGFYIIARVADWVKSLNENIEFAGLLLVDANRIREIIDKNILKIKLYGKLPSKIDIFKINNITTRIINNWEYYKNNKEIERGLFLNIKRKMLHIKFVPKKK